MSIALTRLADDRGPLGTPRAERRRSAAPAAAEAPSGWLGVLSLIARHRYLAAVAVVALFTNWVNTNGENVLFRVVQEALSHEVTAQGIVDTAAVKAFVREGTTAFYGNFFFWVNAWALVAQALFASRLLRYGGFAAVLLMLPAISFVSYTAMALLPVMAVVRVMKVAENGTNYSINNTARQVLWLPDDVRDEVPGEARDRRARRAIGRRARRAHGARRRQVLDLSTQTFLLANVGWSSHGSPPRPSWCASAHGLAAAPPGAA